MTIEIERKFLVEGDGWRTRVTGAKRIRQAYLAKSSAASVRIRLIDETEARLTVKGAANGEQAALVRHEFEYAVPVDDARAMLDLRIGRILEKTRHLIPAGNDRIWEVDEFTGALAGLVLAEIELTSADEEVILPDWIDREVTGDRAYSNEALALA